MAYSGSLEKMTISAYSDDKFSASVGQPFKVTINPDKYKQTYEVMYSNVKSPGCAGGSPEFNRVGVDTLTFELVFDGTGVVPTAVPGVVPFSEDGISSQIEAFKLLIYTYKGNTHSPNFIKLFWGTMLFKGRLKTLDLTYTLFKPDGTPLRAKANLTFIGYTDRLELAKKSNKSSPDLSHRVTVKAGDTLPLMCFKVYGSSAPYLAVARVNQLTSFRSLVAGEQLLFPPLVAASPLNPSTNRGEI
jgi:hypothetical protein